MATLTPNYSLEKPDASDPFGDFRESYNDNLDIIDANLGGGGGGGHVILDPNGTSMAQEPNLQFAGKVGVADDGINTKTVVTVPEEIKEVTQAEYEALPDTKLTDGVAYFIKDVNASNIQGYPPLIYSDVEREIGVWRDGKPLYQKTVHIANLPNGSPNDWVFYNVGLSNLETVAKVHGVLHFANGYQAPLPYVVSNPYVETAQVGMNINPSGEIGIMVNTDRSTVSAYITIQYTKATDVAGSGIWNGQGGIAHHYSSNETVVGTWFGKPLYEKTFTPTSPATANQVTVIEDITSLNIDVPVDIRGNISNVPINWSLDASNSTTCFVNSAKTGIAMKVINNLLTNITCNITLRYTKTTD